MIARLRIHQVVVKRVMHFFHYLMVSQSRPNLLNLILIAALEVSSIPESSQQAVSYFLMRSHVVLIHNPSSLSLKFVSIQSLANSSIVVTIFNE